MTGRCGSRERADPACRSCEAAGARAGVAAAAEHPVGPGERPLVAEPTLRNAVVLAAHPDDESMGCAGTIALLGRAGARVTVVFVHGWRTDTRRRSGGGGGGPAAAGGGRGGVPLARCPRIRFWGLPDGSLTEHVEDLAAAAERLFAEVRPDGVLLPWFLDDHPDHAAVAAALDRRPPATTVELWGYEVWTPLPANRIVDVTAVVALKQGALGHPPDGRAGLRHRRRPGSEPMAFGAGPDGARLGRRLPRGAIGGLVGTPAQGDRWLTRLSARRPRPTTQPYAAVIAAAFSGNPRHAPRSVRGSTGTTRSARPRRSSGSKTGAWWRASPRSHAGVVRRTLGEDRPTASTWRWTRPTGAGSFPPACRGVTRRWRGKAWRRRSRSSTTHWR